MMNQTASTPSRIQQNTIGAALSRSARKHGDKLETVVADDLWPLPTYREMLFIK